MRTTGDLFGGAEFLMRANCPQCGHENGTIKTVNGQDTVRCANCQRFCYNAPKTETGREPRSVTRNREPIKPAVRARILERDGFACVMCHRKENLHVGHILSIKDGEENPQVDPPLTDDELNHDANLAAMCDECNLGLRSHSLPLRLAISLLRIQIYANKAGR